MLAASQVDSFLHFVLLDFDLEILRDVFLLGLRSLVVKREADGAFAAPLSDFEFLAVCPCGNERVCSERISLCGCGLVSASLGEAVEFGFLCWSPRVPVRVSGELFAFCFVVQRNANGEESIGREMWPDGCCRPVVCIQL